MRKIKGIKHPETKEIIYTSSEINQIEADKYIKKTKRKSK
jgi:hypothetical protein